MSNAEFSEYFKLRRTFGISPHIQLLLIVILYLITVFVSNQEYLKTGSVNGFPLGFNILFAPLYEEILFRGLLLRGIEIKFGRIYSVIFCSFCFGIWHLKNIFILDESRLIYQVLYAGLIIGPILAVVTFKTKSIWPAVILHFSNNLFASTSSLARGVRDFFIHFIHNS